MSLLGGHFPTLNLMAQLSIRELSPVIAQFHYASFRFAFLFTMQIEVCLPQIQHILTLKVVPYSQGKLPLSEAGQITMPGLRSAAIASNAADNTLQ